MFLIKFLRTLPTGIHDECPKIDDYQLQELEAVEAKASTPSPIQPSSSPPEPIPEPLEEEEESPLEFPFEIEDICLKILEMLKTILFKQDHL